MEDQGNYESAAGACHLSPAYFEHAARIDEQRQQLEARLAELEMRE